KILKRTVFILLVLIMPVAFAIHTVTSWLFAVNPRAGWHSTIFGPYFVAGAFMVGAAAVIVAMYVFRKTRKNMENYITDKHFSMMGKLLALTGIVYLYFNINEYLVPGYLMEKREGAHLIDLFLGHDALLFWATQIGGLVLPIILLIFKPFRKPLPAAIIAVAVVFFAWTKRYLIVVPTQFNPSFPIQNVPESWHHYIPTYYEITITMMTIGIILLLITWFAKYFPIVPVWETMKDKGIQDKMLDGYHEDENKE
ncbi:MAG: polysulfide reductase NrfD, partial [Bacteroidetes bacterium]|nr:polysulfide reductase NrfD [Bacteroidota bacterium]